LEGCSDFTTVKHQSARFFENFGPIGKKSASGAQKTRKTTTTRPPFPSARAVSSAGRNGPAQQNARFLYGTGRFVFMEK